MKPIALVSIAAVAAMVGSVLAGCTSAQPRRAAPSECTSQVGLVESLYEPNLAGISGGYENAPNLLGAPSLYYTGWNLRLARQLGLDLKIATSPVVRWMKTYISNADATPNEGLDRVTQLNLAIRAAKDLDPDFALTEDPFAELLDGSEYRPDDGGAATTAASSLAVVAQLEAGIRPHAEVVQHLLTLVLDSAPTDTVDQLQNTDVPALYALSVAGRLNEVPSASIATDLSSWQATVLGTGDGPVQLGLLAQLRLIAERQHLDVSSVGESFASSLRVGSSGYYSVAPGSPPDPQVTYDAAIVGLVQRSPAVEATAVRHLGPNGWIANSSPPSLEATYAAIEILRSCERELPHIESNVVASMRVLGGESFTPEAGLQAESLATVYGIPVPQALRDRAKQYISTALDSHDLVGAAIAATASGEAPPQALVTAALQGEIDDAATAVAACQIAKMSDSKALEAKAHQVFAKLRTGRSYRQSRSASAVDILSTALALSCVSDAADAKASIEPFRDGRYFANTTGGIVDLNSILASVSIGSAPSPLLALI